MSYNINEQDQQNIDCLHSIIMESLRSDNLDTIDAVLANRAKETKDKQYLDLFYKKESPIKKLLSIVTKWNKDKLANQYMATRQLSDQVNSLYKSIGTLLKKFYSPYQFDAIQININVTQPTIIEKKGSKNYKFQVAAFGLNVYKIMELIRNGYKDCSNGDYTYLNQTRDLIKKVLDDTYWYIFDTDIVKHIMATRGNPYDMANLVKTFADYDYQVLYAESSTNDDNVAFATVFNKAYAEAERLVKSYKESLKIIDEIFNDIIKYNQGAMEWNFKGTKIALESMEECKSNLEMIFEKIKK